MPAIMSHRVGLAPEAVAALGALAPSDLFRLRRALERDVDRERRATERGQAVGLMLAELRRIEAVLRRAWDAQEQAELRAETGTEDGG